MHFSQTLAATLALTGAAVAKNIVVQVSDQNADLEYIPNNIKADVGDTVEFIFNPNNHTVAESSFGQPCVPLAQSTPGSTGFNSGFMPVKKGADSQPTFTVTIKDSNPHWFYCAQQAHCEKGMVGVINAPAAKPANNIDSFKQLAMGVNKTVIPDAIGGGQAGTIAASASNSTSRSNSTSTGSSGGSMTSGVSLSAVVYTTALTYTSGGSVYTTQATATTQVSAQVTHVGAAEKNMIGSGLFMGVGAVVGAALLI